MHIGCINSRGIQKSGQNDWQQVRVQFYFHLVEGETWEKQMKTGTAVLENLYRCGRDG